MNRKATGAFRLMALSCAVLAWSPTFGATYDQSTGYVRLLGHNAGNSGESTFVTNIVKASAYGWSDLRDPHSDTNYYCGVQLCTPEVTNGSYSWNGGKLVLAGDFRFLSDGQTISIGDLQLEGGMRFQTADGNYSEVLRGSVTVLATELSPAKIACGASPASWKIESTLKGGGLAYIRAERHAAGTVLGAQYVELDDAALYEGTFEVRDGLRLKLFSDLAGTITLTNASVLEISSKETIVGAINLSDGSVIDLSVGGSLSVTNSFLAQGRIAINVSDGVAGARALISVPVGKGVLSADEFTLNIPSRLGRLWVETADGMQTLYGEQLTFSSYNETTGFVVLESNSPNQNQFDEASVWSDGRRPHTGTNHCSTSYVIWCATNSIFPGRSLTVGDLSSVRLKGECRLTVNDLRVYSTTKYNAALFTPNNNGGRYYLSGCMTVLSRLGDTWPFSFFGSTVEGQTWVSDQTIVGDVSSALMVRGHFNSAPGAVNNYLELVGDLTRFYGTLIVATNETVLLGNSAFPGTIRLDTPHSHVDTLAAANATVNVGTLMTLTACSIAVAATNSIHFSSVNVTGALVKNGAGTMGVASTTLGTGAALRIAAGGLKPLSSDAFGGMPLTFADGTGLVMDAAPEDEGLASGGVDLTDSSIVAEGSLSVVFEADAGDPAFAGDAPVCLPIATVTPAQVSAIAFATPRLVCGDEVRKGRIITEPSGDNVLLKADFRRLGMMMIIK